MANVTLQIDADGAKAIQTLIKLAQAQGQVERETKKAADASKAQAAAEREAAEAAKAKSVIMHEHVKGLDKLVRGADSSIQGADASTKSFNTGLLGIAAGAVSIGTLDRAWQHYNETMKSIQDRQAGVAQSLISLAMLLPPGESQAYRERAQLHGASKGMTRDQTLQIYQQAVSAYGADAAPGEATSAMDLANVVGNAEYAKEALGLADEFGMSTKDFAGLLVGSAAVSKKDEDTFVKAARDLATFNIKGKYDPVAGFAAMTAMSGKFGKDELGTFTQSAGLAITVPNTLTENIKGFGDMSAEQRLSTIRDKVTSKYGDTSVGSLQKSGITELRQQRALEAIFSQWDIFQQVMREGPTYKDTYDPGKRLAELEMSDPGVRQEMIRRRGAAYTELMQTTGKSGDEAYNQQLRDQYEASRLGYNPLLVNEQGAPRSMVRKAIDLGGWLQNANPSTQQLEEGVYREQNKLYQEQIEALNKNTEAIKETKTEKKEVRNRNANNEP